MRPRCLRGMVETATRAHGGWMPDGSGQARMRRVAPTTAAIRTTFFGTRSSPQIAVNAASRRAATPTTAMSSANGVRSNLLIATDPATKMMSPARMARTFLRMWSHRPFSLFLGGKTTDGVLHSCGCGTPVDCRDQLA